MAENDTKQRLLLATIAVIERKGLQATTSREIASEASANVAALNYHFGSKSRLIELVMELTINNGMADFDVILLESALPFRSRLYDFYVQMLAGGLRYPNIARAHLYGAMIKGEARTPFMLRLGSLLNSALDDLGDDDLPLGRAETARRIELGIRAILMHCVAPQLFEVAPIGPAGVQEEARRLVELALPQ